MPGRARGVRGHPVIRPALADSSSQEGRTGSSLSSHERWVLARGDGSAFLEADLGRACCYPPRNHYTPCAEGVLHYLTIAIAGSGEAVSYRTKAGRLRVVHGRVA